MNSNGYSDNFMIRVSTNHGEVLIPNIDQIFLAIDKILRRRFTESTSISQQLEDPNNNTEEKEELLNSLGLESSEPIDADSLDTTGLFPDRILDFIKTDQELYAVFKTFFPDEDDNESQQIATNSGNENHAANVECPSPRVDVESNRKRPRKKPFGEKKLPAKKCRKSNNMEDLTRDGSKSSKSGYQRK